MATQPGIFISYRREDASGHAGRLYDRLCERFGKNRLFMDVDTLELGLDFVEGIEHAIGSAGVLLAVIGRSWIRVEDEHGKRRLDDPNDFVRLEIAGALERNIRVIPVLVQGANMPTKEELPDPLKNLTRRTALELRDTSWEYGVDKLGGVLEPLLAEGEPEPESKPEPEPETAPVSAPELGRPGATALLALVGSAVLAIGLGLLRRHFFDHRFPGTIVPSGVLQAPAPLAVLAGCLLSALAIWSKGARAGWLALGLLLGFGFEAAVKGLSLIREPQPHVGAGAWLWVVGGLIVIAGGLVSLPPIRERMSALRELEPELPVAATLLLALAAVLMVVGAALPFSVLEGTQRSVAGHSWWGVDPIGSAVAVAVAIALLYAGLRPLAAGLLVALGIAGTLLWARYVGVPFLQWVDNGDPVAAPRAGGIVGGAGAFLVLVTGWALARKSRPVELTSPEPGYPLPTH